MSAITRKIKSTVKKINPEIAIQAAVGVAVVAITYKGTAAINDSYRQFLLERNRDLASTTDKLIQATIDRMPPVPTA